MNDNIEIKHKEWLSSAGLKQEHWAVLRNGWELGTVSLAYNNKWLAIITQDCGKQYKNKQFVGFETAVKWLVKSMATIRPMSELNAFLA